MMDRKQALEALLARLYAGEAVAADFESCLAVLDFGLAWSAYHGSLDAAKALHDAVLPGWKWGRQWSTHMWVESENMPCHDGFYGDEADHNNPARAWLCAILKALIAREAE